MEAKTAPKTPRVPSKATSKASGKRKVREFPLGYKDEIELPIGWTPFAVASGIVYAYKES